jgi:hypothetical protein
VTTSISGEIDSKSKSRKRDQRGLYMMTKVTSAGGMNNYEYMYLIPKHPNI